MRGPYTVQRERYAGRGNYEADGEPVTVAELPEARALVRSVTDETGILPRVTAGGQVVHVFTDAEVAKW